MRDDGKDEPGSTTANPVDVAKIAYKQHVRLPNTKPITEHRKKDEHMISTEIQALVPIHEVGDLISSRECAGSWCAIRGGEYAYWDELFVNNCAVYVTTVPPVTSMGKILSPEGVGGPYMANQPGVEYVIPGDGTPLHVSNGAGYHNFKPANWAFKGAGRISLATYTSRWVPDSVSEGTTVQVDTIVRCTTEPTRITVAGGPRPWGLGLQTMNKWSYYEPPTISLSVTPLIDAGTSRYGSGAVNRDLRIDGLASPGSPAEISFWSERSGPHLGSIGPGTFEILRDGAPLPLDGRWIPLVVPPNGRITFDSVVRVHPPKIGSASGPSSAQIRISVRLK